MLIKRNASVVWNGGIKDGKGAITTGSGALKAYPYGFGARFEDKPGTNPEELLAAAHASCFTMALSLFLTEASLVPQELSTSAEVVLEQKDGGFTITQVHLLVKGRVPGADAAKFQAVAQKAKENCPLSKVLKADISMTAELLT
jgi:lipoyl-dependent peroxiredoxin